MRERQERSLRRKIIVAGILGFLVLGLLAGALSAGERDSCWVEYAPGEVRDFAYFESMDRGLNSRVVTYEFHRGSSINQYYEDQDTAKQWMAKVVRQLRGCN